VDQGLTEYHNGADLKRSITVSRSPEIAALPNIWNSKKGLMILLITAVSLSLLFVVAHTLQGPSLFWNIQGSEIEVRVVRFPFESASRTYRLDAITDIGTTPTADGSRMIVFEYGNLSLQSPWQNSHVISDFDVYALALKHLIDRGHTGHKAELKHYNRGFPLAVATLISAVLAWIVFFSMALIVPRIK